MGRAFPFQSHSFLFPQSHFMSVIFHSILNLNGSVVEDPFTRDQSKNENGALSSGVEEERQEIAAVIRRINGLLSYHEILGLLTWNSRELWPIILIPL